VAKLRSSVCYKSSMSRCSRLHRRHLEQESVRNLWPPQVHASVEVHLWQLQRGGGGSAHASVWHTSRCSIYGACPVVMGAVAVVRVGLLSGHLSGHHAGHAESWHDLACICRGTRSHGTTSHARGVGMGSVERVRPDPRVASETDDLCVLGAHRSSRPFCPVARCVLRDECRARGPR
jgi:hypothetical protein